jgi:hypothetical protein
LFVNSIHPGAFDAATVAALKPTLAGLCAPLSHELSRPRDKRATDGAVITVGASYPGPLLLE